MAARRGSRQAAGGPAEPAVRSKSTARRNAIRRSQAITTWGPGALLDLPQYSVMVSGLDHWGAFATEEAIVEPRLSGKIRAFLELDHDPQLFAPPRPAEREYDRARQVTAWRFPEWFIVQEAPKEGVPTLSLSRRLVHRTALDRNKFDGRPVVATRFVQACRLGHIDDVDWRKFAHGEPTVCREQMWFDEAGTTGDLVDLTIRCDCGARRRLIDAMDPEEPALDGCIGKRPWLGNGAPLERCNERARLLNRQATNAYFGKTLSVLALPDRSAALSEAIEPHLDILLNFVPSVGAMPMARRMVQIARSIEGFSDEEVFEALERRRGSHLGATTPPVKFVELDALLAAPPGYDDTIPLDTNFHARMLPDADWRPEGAGTAADFVERVVQVHRLREVVALLGFTRFEATSVDADGDYSGTVQAAKPALHAKWYPAIENRGEGIFLQVRPEAIDAWLGRPEVEARVAALKRGHTAWVNTHPWGSPNFRGGAYLMLHTLAHLLCQVVAVRSGYPSSAIRERIYADDEGGRYGVLLYTGTADADGTLGGLVQEAFGIAGHLEDALDGAAICSNDPICAAHAPGDSLEERFLHGAACHGCVLIGETSCEARNDHLDRALVVPILGVRGTAFFRSPP
jgi:hypothetical protein